jgi:two-component system response regulator YesN
MAEVFTVVVAEDEELLAASIVRRIHEADAGFRVVGSAPDGKAALEMVESLSPDLLVTDIRMPVMDGLELLRILAASHPHIRKIVVSGFDDFQYAQKAMEYEVRTYLLKPLKKAELADALCRIRIGLERERNLLPENRIDLRVDSPNALETVRLVESYLRENYAGEIHLEELARRFHITASYLSRIFLKHAGQAPARYVMQLRINRAKYLLLHNRGLNIREIGEMVGYPDQFYFSRVFKNVTGRSPQGFRIP